MSSLERRFSTRVVPEESAARRRQRLERDLEPGRVTVPEMVFMGGRVRVLVVSVDSGLVEVVEEWSWCRRVGVVGSG